MNYPDPVPDDAIAATAPTHQRVRAGLRRSHNWFQLIRFGAVGASGYVVNLGVFTLLVHAADVKYVLAAVGAYLVAVANNFTWNRIWTFQAQEGHAGFQAARFFLVSLVAFGFQLAILALLVSGFDAPEVPAQAFAIAMATPLNFIGNKLWSFRT